MPSPELGLSDAERALLGEIAWTALGAAVRGERAGPAKAPFGGRLAARGASFVSLHRGGELRGCIGSLEARRPLAEDVATNARAAALEDTRFRPVEASELAELEMEISVLTPTVPLPVASESELLARLRPDLDGLVLEERGRRATFLPAVWRDLPAPADFLAHLKRKAGLPPDYWSPTLRFWRYGVESFPAPASGRASAPARS
jgi:AmmeMemoRadiSam system protein A